MLTLFYFKQRNMTTLDQRKFIESQAKKGKTSAVIAEQLGISIWTVRKWRQRLKKSKLLCQ